MTVKSQQSGAITTIITVIGCPIQTLGQKLGFFGQT